MFMGREALYGGAAGGGKSYALLMAALQYVHEPTYRALIIRRTYKQLSKSDSILSTAEEWLLPRKDVGYSKDSHCFRFPSGARLEFGHMEHEKNKFDYQGAAYHFVAYDELTQFEEPMYTYLFSRQRRRAESTIPTRMRSASNPGGVGHEWVKKRFIEAETRKPAVMFVPARLDDNRSASTGEPNIDQADYLESLKELDPITRLQLERGDWDAYAGGRFKREWFRRWRRAVGPGEYHLLKPDGGFQFIGAGKFKLIFQTCDPAASEKTTADYTVICTWGLTQENQLVWLDMVRFQKDIPDIPPLVLSTYQRWQPSYIAIEAVAANNAIAKLCSRLPMIVKAVSPLGNDKLTRATPAMVFAEEGRLYLPLNAHWLDDAESELIRFTGNEKLDAHDDICLRKGTLVETVNGGKEIETIQVGEYVLTRNGYRKVSHSGMTSECAELHDVILSNGDLLSGTASHRVFVHGKGWVRIDMLMTDDKLYACEPKLSGTMAGNTHDTPIQNIGQLESISGQQVEKSQSCTFISRFGLIETGQSPMADSFTTKTGIQAITTPKIYSASLKRNTTAFMMPLESLLRQETNQEPGTAVMPEESGTESKQKRQGSSGNRELANAKGVGKISKRNQSKKPYPLAPLLAEPLCTEKKTTSERPKNVSNVVASTEISEVNHHTVPIRVICVRATGLREPVYNLTVDGEPEFFANGVLVHNCDCLSYACAVLQNRIMTEPAGKAQVPFVHQGR